MTTPLLRTLPGRLFLLSSALLLVLWVSDRLVTLPEFVQIFHKVVSLAFIVSTTWVVSKVLSRNWRRFLWRVRRKLVLSYVLLAFVPIALIVVFVLVGGWMLYSNVAAFMFHDGYQDVVNEVQQVAATAATETLRDPAAGPVALARKYENLSSRFPGMSLAMISVKAAPSTALSVAGAWRHGAPPTEVPVWLRGAKFSGTIVLPAPTPSDDPRLVVRAAMPVAPENDISNAQLFVVVDLPIDTALVARLNDSTGALVEGVTVIRSGQDAPAVEEPSPNGAKPGISLFRRTTATIDTVDWTTGKTGGVTVGLQAPFGQLYRRMAATQPNAFASQIVMIMIMLATLFLLVQSSAVFFGTVLARSITSSVHELFAGTERIRQGDFTHRIPVTSQDQLGDLADSFNRMSASIEHLLHVQREKQRLDDELRIAREIQKSLLPTSTPTIAGLGVADLCEPAREVGGDYYDFFEIGPRQLGVLVADVSGKGTSAALYMAELKGLMLALSRTERSPRKLLITLNTLLADHLDNRSFITMTYAVLDLEAGTLTHARAGHTPLLVVSGRASSEPEVLVPDGMVLGLRLPGASTRFEAMLKEDVRPIVPGDVIVLYTDGITEAMNADGDLFGDDALAAVVSAQRGLTAAGIRERVLRDVKAFVGAAEPHDDMTMIVLKLDGACA